MAGSSFERTFEFKVNDTALKRATVRLFRSLERIEKKLDEIGGKGGKGFDACLLYTSPSPRDRG